MALYLQALLLFLFFLSDLHALSFSCKPYSFFLGPEVYYAYRTKEGGSHQDGWLYGVSGTYERWICRGLYWGVDGYWATGELKGKSPSGNTLESDLTQYRYEGRLGYSFQFRCLFLSLYGAYGDFSNENSFKDPSPIPYTSRDTFDYGALGIQGWMKLNKRWSAGAHFKVLYMNEGRSYVEDDPEFDDETLVIGNEVQYEFYLPIRYGFCCKGFNTAAVISPFFRYYHFGFQENFPFDNFDTKYRIYGAKVQLQITF